MKIPPVKIHFPESDRAEILAKIGETLETGQLTMGKHGRAFEEAFAELCGTQHAVAVNSGTSAIEIPMRVHGVEGRTVLVPTNTFFATVLAVTHAGGKVRFVAADPPSCVALVCPDCLLFLFCFSCVCCLSYVSVVCLMCLMFV